MGAHAWLTARRRRGLVGWSIGTQFTVRTDFSSDRWKFGSRREFVTPAEQWRSATARTPRGPATIEVDLPAWQSRPPIHLVRAIRRLESLTPFAAGSDCSVVS